MKDPIRCTPPAANELEVSVFGLRKGESIVVHVPDGPWFVIDSMAAGVGKERRPVAATYLRDCLGVSELYGVFLTHWHDDHTAGAALLLNEFASSLKKAGVPIAFSTRELMAYVADLLPDAQRAGLIRDTLEIMSALKTAPLAGVHVVTLTDGVHLQPASATWKLEALSPSTQDQRAQAATIAKFLPGFTGTPATSFDVNSGCAVLRLEVEDLVVMFASDLDIGDAPDRGWQAVLQSHGPRLASKLVKVGHHGSETALHHSSWDAMGLWVNPAPWLRPSPPETDLFLGTRKSLS